MDSREGHTRGSGTSRAYNNRSSTNVGFSLADDEDAQLGPSDRFTQSENEAIPTTSFACLSLDDNDPPGPLSKDVDTLSSAYPSVDPGAISAVLIASDNDVATARRILDASAPMSSQMHLASLPKDSNTNPSENGGNDSHTDSDATLAEFLQRQEQARAALIRSKRIGRTVRLERPEMERLVSSLREIVIPALRAHFEELVLPDTRDETGLLVYELQNVQVAALALPAENVTVCPGADSRHVLVNVVGSNLELEVGRWSYENSSFTRIKDAGRARASIHGLNVSIRLEPRMSDSQAISIDIAQCETTVDGIFRFKTQGAGADWAYNAIAVVFKPWVVSYVKETVSDAVVRALSVHLRQLEIASSFDQPSAAVVTDAEVTSSPSIQSTQNQNSPVSATE